MHHVVLSTSAPPLHVLLIEPDPTHRQLLSQVLSERGFEVLVAVDGRQGMEYFLAHPIDVVVIERDLPDFSGLEICRSLQQRDMHRQVPILMSGIGGGENEFQLAFQVGATDYLRKPLSPEEISARVEHAVDSVELNRSLTEQNIALSTELDEGQRQLDGAYRQVKLQLLNQRALFDVSHELNSSIDVDEQINLLLLTVMAQLGIEMAATFIAVEEGPLKLHSSKGVPRDKITEVRLECEDGFLGRLEERGRSQTLEELRAGISTGGDLESLVQMGIELASPILTGSRLAGVLLLGPKMGGRPFEDSDLMLLSSLLASAGIAMEKAELFRKLQESYIATIQSLMSAMEAKDTYTRGHTARVSRYALAIAKAMGFNKEALEEVKLGATLHDIGKIGIHEGILNKPSGLTPDELEIMKEHPAMGDRILRKISFLQGARKMVRHHHERWDGGGYPDGLKGEDISLGARIVTVADSFDAMTSKRTYSEGMGLDEAIWNLTTKTKTQFCAETVGIFVSLLRDESIALPSWMRD